ncbi:MAG: cysteine--tRNA ligase [Planctomycetes bacterium]|nr:cysteine--tRNA ligase [Planctomycetota bacterium]
MSLKLYNTLTRKVDEFRSIRPGEVALYTCGPTVYNYAHIGNLRTYIFEDVLKRSLGWCGWKVKHVMNVTDVGHLTSDADSGQDKMEKGAAREGKSVWEIAGFYWQAFKEDLVRLNILPPDVWCKATDHIAEQIGMVKALEAKGLIYRLEDGIYFDTGKLGDYGRLARLDVAGLQAGARVDLVQGKRNVTDFAVWKFSPKDSKRLMEWPSPWGVGFPGWHLECSAMALKYLGEQLDIHCGGVDHVAVHHTNEIAQTESITGKQWVSWWMHGEFLTMGEGARMAKSEGGFLTLQALIDKGYDPPAYRYFCLNAHYRQQLAFRWESLDSAATAFERLRNRAIELRQAAAANSAGTADAQTASSGRLADFREAVEDDLNMPRALAAMWGLLKNSKLPARQAWADLLDMDRVLGFGLETIQPRKIEVDADLAARVEKLIAERTAAKKEKNFARADEIRKQIAELGVELKDTPQGPVWRKL